MMTEETESTTKNDKSPHSFLDFTSDSRQKSAYVQTGIEKWFNILLCRGDLAHESLDAAPVSFVELFKYGTRNDKVLVALGILFAVVTGCGQPFSNYLGGKMTTTLINGEHGDKAKLWHDGYQIVMINAIVGVTVVLITFIQYYCLRLACRNITNTLRSRFIRSVLRQDAAYFDCHKSGEINNQLNESINQIRDGIGDKIGMMIRGVSMLITTTVMSFLINWRMTMIMIATSPVCCIVMSFMARLISNATKKQMRSSERATAILHESIMNVKTIQSCNGQSEMVDKLKTELDSGRIHGVLSYFWNGFFDGLFFFFIYLFFALGFYYGGIQYYYGQMEAGDVFIIANSITMGAYFIGMLSPHIMVILKARVAAALIYEQIERVPKIDSESDLGVRLERPRGLIEFQDVHFSYPTRSTRPVLKGISWVAEPGETVAFVGQSGCGKSTSILLLTRLYEATGGRVCIDGVDVRSLHIQSLRKCIGVVNQEPCMFSGTIFENITLGDPTISQTQVEQACIAAHAHEFIVKLENGYNTLLGSGGGITLSGGQKQRIAIARAVVNSPPILLLDEATSALDAESEIRVQEALRDASKGRTTIIVAHRLSTLRDVEKIIVIDDGRIVEMGSHSELMNKPNGAYAKLIEAQKFQQTDVDERKSNDEKDQNESEEFQLHGSLQSSIARSSLRDQSIVKEYGETKTNDQPVSLWNVIFGSGLLRLFKNCHNNYGKMIVGTIFSLLRGTELPLYVFIMTLGFVAFKDNAVDFEVYKNRMIWFLVVTILVGLYSWSTIFGAVSFFGWTAECVTDTLKIRALSNVLRQSAEFFDWPNTSNAKLLQRIITNSKALKAGLDTRLYHLINNCFCSLIQILMAAIACWEVTISGMSIYCALFIFLAYLARQMKKAMKEVTDLDDSAKFAVEIIEQTRTIQLLAREEHFCRRFDNSLFRFREFEKRIAICDALMFAFTQSFIFFSDIFCYSIGLYLVYHDYRSSTQVFISSQTLATLSWAILFVSISFNEILHAIPAIDSLLDIVDAPSIVDDHENDGIEPEVKGDVAVEKVVFAYPTRPQVNVANGLVLRAKCGENIALVGQSGCGKSTVIQLLQRFYEPKYGQLTVDRSPIRRFSLSYLRTKIGLVSQEPVLFSGTIYENIRLGIPNATQEDVFEAAKLANASMFIERLPQGYQTEIGDKGSRLSGGQKQRIAIARAIARKPQILLLDEATSALDSESEKAVQRALDSASDGRTVISIAHRLSSIQYADQIFFIQNGRVVEAGTHNELLSRDGSLYAAMIAKQDLSH
ncbi:hypothetical protein M3Y94_01121600 [Aphelenchoides besseyi]|nr:hypothetical protein M3Y94_01121600 [Aphelenchoides besseyi]